MFIPKPVQLLRLCVVEEKLDERFIFAVKRLEADNFVERDDVRITDIRWEESAKLRESVQELFVSWTIGLGNDRRLCVP